MGATPRYIWLEQRLSELYDTVFRFRAANLAPHIEWLEEIVLLEKQIKTEEAERRTKACGSGG